MVTSIFMHVCRCVYIHFLHSKGLRCPIVKQTALNTNSTRTYCYQAGVAEDRERN